jgi:hypothetical protein
MTRDEALRLLGLDEDATEADIRLAYKEMAQILHPDKYADNKKLAERATEQFKHVNEARELLLGGRSAARRGGRRTDSAGSARAGGAGGAGGTGRGSGSARTSAGYAGAGYGEDRASALKARLAGIAAARVQLTTQLDAELDRRRVGIYLTAGGFIALLVGRVLRPLLAIAPVAIVSGIVQLYSSRTNIKIIRGHLTELERGRKECEKELEEI